MYVCECLYGVLHINIYKKRIRFDHNLIHLIQLRFVYILITFRLYINWSQLIQTVNTF